MDLKKVFIKDACPTKVGGQAVLDGIMMRGETRRAIALRMPDDSLYMKVEKLKAAGKWAKVPLLRGVYAFGSAMVEGTKIIMYSADKLEEYESKMEGADEGDKKKDKITLWLEKRFGSRGAWNVMLYFSVILALIFTILIFVIAPTAMVNLLKHFTHNEVMLNLVEGLVRIALFVLYVALISKMEDIKKVFQFHGAEHQCIHCFENGMELKPDNCRNFLTLHPRCGTSFLMFVLVISLVLFSMLGWPSLFWRIASRVMLLPVIAGISYELLRWAGRSDNWVVKILSIPGLLLQKLTTRRPDDAQLEVAIVAMNAVLDKEQPLGEGSCDKEGRWIDVAGGDGIADTESLRDIAIKTAELEEIRRREGREMTSLLVSDVIKMAEKQLATAGVESPKIDAELLYCYLKRVEKSKFFLEWSSLVDDRTCEQFFALVERRCRREPLQYITGIQDFMGLSLMVREGVLIPRMDTETVALAAELKLKEMRGDSVLDLCCGTGAIGIALAKRCRAKVTAVDINPSAVKLAKDNAMACGVKVTALEGDLFQPVSKKKYNMIVSNPPYIPTEDMKDLMPEVSEHEPREALDGGTKGMDFYNRIIKEAGNHLKKKGLLVLEIGADQAKDVKEIFGRIGGFEPGEVLKDLAGFDRVVIARKAS